MIQQAPSTWQERELRAALAELVRLKKYKSEHGADNNYLTERRLAWDKAQRVLEETEREDA